MTSTTTLYTGRVPPDLDRLATVARSIAGVNRVWLRERTVIVDGRRWRVRLDILFDSETMTVREVRSRVNMVAAATCTNWHVKPIGLFAMLEAATNIMHARIGHILRRLYAKDE